MKQHELVWIVAAACLTWAVGTVAWLTVPRWMSLNLANYERIQVGMTMSEVKGVLGGPPGYYCMGNWTLGPPGIRGPDDWWQTWADSERVIEVKFTHKYGRVSHVRSSGVSYSPPPSPIDRFRVWLGW